MNHQISVKYLGDLRTESIHLKSSSSILTDAPTDNQGLGRKFSPTDLIASALGSCLLTIMGIVAKRHKICMDGSFIEVEKIMGQKPRRIKKINLDMHMNQNIKSNDLKILKNAAKHCPVHNSLNKDIEIKIIFI